MENPITHIKDKIADHYAVLAHEALELSANAFVSGDQKRSTKWYRKYLRYRRKYLFWSK